MKGFIALFFIFLATNIYAADCERTNERNILESYTYNFRTTKVADCQQLCNDQINTCKGKSLNDRFQLCCNDKASGCISKCEERSKKVEAAQPGAVKAREEANQKAREEEKRNAENARIKKACESKCVSDQYEGSATGYKSDHCEVQTCKICMSKC